MKNCQEIKTSTCKSDLQVLVSTCMSNTIPTFYTYKIFLVCQILSHLNRHRDPCLHQRGAIVFHTGLCVLVDSVRRESSESDIAHRHISMSLLHHRAQQYPLFVLRHERPRCARVLKRVGQTVVVPFPDQILILFVVCVRTFDLLLLAVGESVPGSNS